jgi:hypothetical protein
MTLSEAIRYGSGMKPQAFGEWRGDGSSCALGAAMDALHVEAYGQLLNAEDVGEDLPYDDLTVTFPWLEGPAKCPACSLPSGIFRRWWYEEVEAQDVIIHLNDDHRWSREAIAEWVARMEPPETRPPLPQVRWTAREPREKVTG